MLLALLTACGGTLTYIDVSGETSTTVEQGTLLEEVLGSVGFDEFISMDLTASQELANQGVEPGDITSAVLTSFELEALSGSPDLSFLHSMILTVEAPDVAPVEVASCTDFPENQAVVAFDLTSADIAPAVVSQSLSIVTEVDAQRPNENTKIEARYVVHVGVTLQGAKRAASEG